MKNIGIKRIEFYGALNAENVTCATNAVYFRGFNTKSNILMNMFGQKEVLLKQRKKLFLV